MHVAITYQVEADVASIRKIDVIGHEGTKAFLKEAIESAQTGVDEDDLYYWCADGVWRHYAPSGQNFIGPWHYRVRDEVKWSFSS